MTYLKKFIGIKTLNAKQCPVGSKVSGSVCIELKLVSLPYLPKIMPLPKMSPPC